MCIVCASCGSAITAEHVNLDRMVAKCVQCHAVFDFSDQLAPAGAQRGGGSAPLQRKRAPVPLPQGIEMIGYPGTRAASYRESPRDDGALVIVRRWFATKHIGMLFFCIAWDSFLVFWYSAAFATKVWLMIVFPIAHVAVGVGLTYTTLAGLLNRTRITVANGALEIRHGPIPWRGNRRVRAEELTQLFCEEGKVKGGSVYHLSAVMREGHSVKLVSNIDHAEQALFLEQVIEERLGIVDVAVGGEYVGQAG